MPSELVDDRSRPLPPPGRPGRLALALAYAGLLPFVAGAALIWIVRADALPHVGAALSAYAALIVSFLGGIHWGLAMRSAQPAPGEFGWAIAAALVAWIAVLMPFDAALVIHGVMLVVAYVVDRRVYPRHGLAHWLTLRFRLSGVAALSCFLAAAGS